MSTAAETPDPLLDKVREAFAAFACDPSYMIQMANNCRRAETKKRWRERSDRTLVNGSDD